MKFPFLAMCLGACFFALTAQADESDTPASQAASLLRVIIAGEPAPQRCRYESDWASNPLPEGIAREYLGSTLHADLSAPMSNADFQATVDPEKRFAFAFCDAAGRDAYESARFDAFEKDKAAKTARVDITALSFPIFDARYRRAVVVIDRYGLDRDRLDFSMGKWKRGDVVRHPGFSAVQAYLYLRTKGGWKLTKHTLISIS